MPYLQTLRDARQRALTGPADGFSRADRAGLPNRKGDDIDDQSVACANIVGTARN
jgi:hypothetical protein